MNRKSEVSFDNLSISRDGNVGILTISRPYALNALNISLLDELDKAISLVESDKQIKVLIITGEGKAFVAGADISEMKNFTSEEGRKFGELGSSVFRKIELLDKPVIAAVNGFALGGGCELAMSCDIRIASEKARFGQPETGLGITPGFSGCVRLPRIVGLSRAKEMIFTGEMIGAEEAERIGLVNRVVPADDLMNVALDIALKICYRSQPAVRYSKMAINRAVETDVDTAIAFENQVFALCFSTEDQKEGMAAFIEKRTSNFRCE